MSDPELGTAGKNISEPGIPVIANNTKKFVDFCRGIDR